MILKHRSTLKYADAVTTMERQQQQEHAGESWVIMEIAGSMLENGTIEAK
ncbi:hypothetical protein HETIRDRAFT_319002 [Heterobasidion irregulare TC 32-1]|uniref:Uncharacterized protein n=1 Tax=Heterobasidion irregulare (strain TC 32-1) TaxID=747525 RepID=W4K8X0_HETIT|nr:uncharacterized protein HETIRDRAFT_319002 [Heterobasidion irregulare TC 32-1]ETW82204.1 hypothetical protein HETIRDRAFT_319002 [Heterobasidion irregulare TC 32-1]